MSNICSSSIGCGALSETVLPLLKLAFKLKAERSGAMPYYSGLTWYHMWGNQIKNLSCVNLDAPCQPCSYKQGCVYGTLFETRSLVLSGQLKENKAFAPPPLVIEPPLFERRRWDKGESCTLCLILLGDATLKAHYFIESLFLLGQKGVGPQCITFSVESVNQILSPAESVPLLHNGQVAYERIRPQRLNWLRPAKPVDRLLVQLKTPLRLTDSCKMFRPLSAAAFLTACYDRVKQLVALYGDPIPEQAQDSDRLVRELPLGERTEWGQIKLHKWQISWVEWKEPVPQQQKPGHTGGWQGLFQLSGELTPFLPLLVAGRELHIGRQTELGLGRFSIYTPYEG